MSYIALYILIVAGIWWASRVGWSEALKIILSVLVPSLLVILFNVRLGRFLFRNPILGIISVLPTVVFIYKTSQPLVNGINSWIDSRGSNINDSQEVVDTEVISKEDA